MGVNDVVSTVDMGVDTPQVVALVAQFHQFARKSAEGVLEMARVVKEASLLADFEFLRFCNRTSLKASSATTRKLIVIGEKYNFLSSNADKLPANWTTIYAVAKLANEQIQSLIDQGVVNTNTAAAELERALSSKTNNHFARALQSAATPADAATVASAVPANGSSSSAASKPQRASFKVELNANLDAASLQAVKHLIEQLTAMKSKVTLNETLALALRE
jgi:hypothetical protein